MLYITDMQLDIKSTMSLGQDDVELTLKIRTGAVGDSDLYSLSQAIRESFRTRELRHKPCILAEALVRALFPTISSEGRVRLADEFLAKALL